MRPMTPSDGEVRGLLARHAEALRLTDDEVDAVLAAALVEAGTATASQQPHFARSRQRYPELGENGAAAPGLVPLPSPREARPALWERLRHWWWAPAGAILLAALTPLALDLLVAWLSYNPWEKHFLDLKRHFSSGAPKPATLAPVTHHLPEPCVSTTDMG